MININRPSTYFASHLVRMILAFGLLLSSLLLPQLAPTLLATGPTLVTTTSLLNDPNDGACSLREALQAAFSQQANGTASQSYNECTVYAGPTTIAFGGSAAAGVLKLTADQDALPMINKEVIIQGPVIIQGGGVPAANATQRDTRLFRVAASGVLTLMNLTLKDGYVGGFGAAIFSNSTSSVINLYAVSLIGNYAEGDGGAISTNGQLNIVLSNFAGNKALGINGPGNTPADGYGGAIKIEGSDKLNLSQTNFAGNIANRGGGAIAVIGATVLISDSVFNGNIAQASLADTGGGAIYSNNNGAFSITRTFFNANLTPRGRGGAIYHALGSAPSIIVDSAFTANVSGDLGQNGMGGALYNESELDIQRVSFDANIASPGKDENANDLPGLGGAILNNHAALLKLSNVSFFANLAPKGKGGALANIDTPNPVGSDSTVEVRNSTFSNNVADSDSGGAIYNEEKVALWNTIIEVGTVGLGGSCGGPKAVVDNGHNLQNPGKSCGAAILEIDPKLDVPKPAHSSGLLAWLLVQSPNEGSPAIDQGDDAVCNAEPVNKLDASNGERPADGDNNGTKVCDIGAVEVGRGLPGYGSEPAQPGPIEFGNVKVGTSADATFEIFETGKLPLGVILDPTGALSGPNAADFQVLPGVFPFVLLNNAPHKVVTLRCTPSAAGVRTATLSLVSDDPFHLSVDYDLTCNGTVDNKPGVASDPIAPGPIDFGSSLIGTPVTRDFQIREIGNAALNVSFKSLSGDNANEFTVVSGLPVSISDSGAAKSVSVRCVPAEIGLRTAILSLNSDDPTQPTLSFDLVCNGEGTPAPFLAPLEDITGLDGAYGVAASPDGAQIYVSNFSAGTLTQFNRTQSNGKVSLAKTYTGSNLTGARKVAVSPDGKQVYVTASIANSLTIYERNLVTGELTQKTIHTNNGIVHGLTGAHGLAVSPDGRNIYVASITEDALVQFVRNANDTVGFKNYRVSTTDLEGAHGVAVSPDGKQVYVVGYPNSSTGSLAVYNRNLLDGSLTHVKTWHDNDLLFFNNLDGLAGAHAVSVSPDNRYIYVAGLHDNAITAFNRDPVTGFPYYIRTYKNGVDGQALGGITSPVFSADGRHLFTTSITDKALGVYDRDAETGLLTFIESFKRDAILGTPKLDSVNEVIVSPEGTNLYAVAGLDDSLVSFALANPRATINALLPASVHSGDPGFTLVIKGKNFVAGSQVLWNNVAKPANFISPQELHVAIPTSDLSTVGSAVLKIVNPAPGGGDSLNSATFKIMNPGDNLQPAINYLNPQGVPAATGSYSMTVRGTGFSTSTKVRWNGQERPTSFVDSNEVIVTISAADIAAAQLEAADDQVTAAALDANQAAGITVFNPAPGGGGSNATRFAVLEAGQNPAPSITQLLPASIIEQGAEAAGLTIKVAGLNFLESTQAFWNGKPRPIKFVNGSEVQVTLTGADVSFAGINSFTLFNPAPSGGDSNAVLFTVQPTAGNPIPTLTQVSPSTILQPKDNSPLVLTITGNNFTPSSGVYLNGVLRPTQLVNNMLQVTLTPTDVVTIATNTLVVINPPPGGGTSNGLSFTVEKRLDVYLPLVRK